MSRHELELAFDRHESTTVVVDRGLLSRPGALAALAGEHERIAVLHDPAVAATARGLAASLGSGIVLPVLGGEAGKTPETALRVAGELLAAGLGRSGLVVAVGGGVVCDLAGFVASIYMRGVATALVPTSLLAMVDAAIGGKTAVDLGGVKNVLGTFHHPRRVLVDPAVLGTLPDAAFRDGLVEVVKKALILDAAAWEWIADHLERILRREPEAVDEAIALAVSLKAAVVREDPREAGPRKLLNFGHTVGHAIETVSRFAVSHGAAVATGMVLEMAAASPLDRAPLLAVLRALGQDAVRPAGCTAEALWEVMRHDKKAAGGRVFVAVPVAPGRGELRPVGLPDLEAACG